MLRATQPPSGPKSRAASDDQLMCAVQAGDTLAFALLYQRHCGLALRLARSVCRDAGRAEDAVQEAFAAAWRSSTSYPARGRGPSRAG
jgi:RNA polymerase sigma-70 factor (ECF subfamily)